MEIVILASQSKRRHTLLKNIGMDFVVRVPDVEEISDGMPPQELVLENARRKWQWAHQHYPGHMVIAADTTVSLDDHCIGKPVNRDDAHEMLRRQSGRTQQVLTGFVMGPAHQPFEGVEISEVTFRVLSDDEIVAYLDYVKPYDRAGAYDIDEQGDWIISCYVGSYSNIMGLPLERIKEWVCKSGI